MLFHIEFTSLLPPPHVQIASNLLFSVRIVVWKNFHYFHTLVEAIGCDGETKLVRFLTQNTLSVQYKYPWTWMAQERVYERFIKFAVLWRESTNVNMCSKVFEASQPASVALVVVLTRPHSSLFFWFLWFSDSNILHARRIVGCLFYDATGETREEHKISLSKCNFFVINKSQVPWGSIFFSVVAVMEE